MASLHRRNPGTLAAARVSKFDLVEKQIDRKFKRLRRNNQPVAKARDFGCVFAVFVRDRGVESRVGRYADTGAAADLNAIFAETAP